MSRVHIVSASEICFKLVTTFLIRMLYSLECCERCGGIIESGLEHVSI